MNVRQFEDKRWSEHDQPIEFRHQAAIKLIEKGSVLDVGCGDGLLLAMLKEKGIPGVGVDISPEAVRKAEAKGLEAHVCDFSRQLPFPDNSFNSVVMLDVLEHLYDPAILLAEAARVAHSEVIIGVPNFSSLPARLQTFLGKVPENNRSNKGHVYWFNYPVLNGLLAKSGLVTKEIRMNAPRQLNFLTKINPNLFALSFVVKARKNNQKK